jgi:hypothetical protein
VAAIGPLMLPAETGAAFAGIAQKAMANTG